MRLCNNRVGPSGRPLRPPSEPYVKVSLHTAQAFQWTYPVWHAPVNSRWSNLCHTHRRPNGTALLTPALRRTNRLASIVICFSQFKRFHRFSDNERPDRRRRIHSITERLWLVRSSPCRLPWACLAVGWPWKQPRRDDFQRLFHVPHLPQDGLGPLLTPAVQRSRRATLESPILTACFLAQALNSLVWLVLCDDACECSINLTIPSDSSAAPD